VSGWAEWRGGRRDAPRGSRRPRFKWTNSYMIPFFIAVGVPRRVRVIMIAQSWRPANSSKDEVFKKALRTSDETASDSGGQASRVTRPVVCEETMTVRCEKKKVRWEWWARRGDAAVPIRANIGFDERQVRHERGGGDTTSARMSAASGWTRPSSRRCEKHVGALLQIGLPEWRGFVASSNGEITTAWVERYVMGSLYGKIGIRWCVRSWVVRPRTHGDCGCRARRNGLGRDLALRAHGGFTRRKILRASENDAGCGRSKRCNRREKME